MRPVGDIAADIVERVAELRPIPTRWNGILYRSRLEARWRIFLDAINAGAEYEPEGFRLEGKPYLVDYYLRAFDLYLEVKPAEPTVEESAKCQMLARASGKPTLVVIGPPSLWRGRMFLPSFDAPEVRRASAGLARCRRCEAMTLTYSADDFWGYRALTACGKPEGCGDRTPEIGSGLEGAARLADDERFEKQRRAAE